jgi:hypothetical protein
MRGRGIEYRLSRLEEGSRAVGGPSIWVAQEMDDGDGGLVWEWDGVVYHRAELVERIQELKRQGHRGPLCVLGDVRVPHSLGFMYGFG